MVLRDPVAPTLLCFRLGFHQLGLYVSGPGVAQTQRTKTNLNVMVSDEHWVHLAITFNQQQGKGLQICSL